MSKSGKVYAEKQADFALNFLRQTQISGLKSLILSPLLISIDLAIIYNGASKDTATQIAKLLTGENPGPKKLNEYFSKIWKQLQSQTSLLFVNRWYINEDIEISDVFINFIKNYYGREIKSMDYYNDIRDKINDTIKAETKNLIKEMIPPGALADDKIFMLINAIHFKGAFLNQFSAQGPFSTPEEFYVSEGVFRYVYMMQTDWETEYLYEAAKDYEVVGLEYFGDEHKMFIILPKERFGLFEVLKKLNGSTLIKLAKNRKKKICYVNLPRFEQTFHLDVTQILKNLGMTNAFNSSIADFSNLSPEKSLLIKCVLHNASIKVFEKGDESDFLTCRPSAPAIGRIVPEPEIKFLADHPFLYFIADKNCNILFFGTIVDNFQPYVEKISYYERLRNPLNSDFFKSRQL